MPGVLGFYESQPAVAPKPEAFFLEPETNYPNLEAKYFSPELIYPGPEAVSLNPETKYPSPEANYPESDAIYLNPETMYLSAEANYHRAEGLYPGHVPFYLRDIARCPGKTSRRRTNAPTCWCTTVGQAVPAPRMQGPHRAPHPRRGGTGPALHPHAQSALPGGEQWNGGVLL